MSTVEIIIDENDWNYDNAVIVRNPYDGYDDQIVHDMCDELYEY